MAYYAMTEECVTSEIITKFLLDTCQQRRQWNINRLNAVGHSCRIAESPCSEDDFELATIPLVTGSVAEMYITPMYACIGDVDIMTYYNSDLAVPAGHPPPTTLPDEFHRRVQVSEIFDSEFPGYVYLVKSYILTECIVDGRYNAVQCPREYQSYRHALSRLTDISSTESHGPAISIDARTLVPDIHVPGLTYIVDLVCAMRCLSWPPQAAGWPTRQRSSGWPDSAAVDCVVSSGCDVVQVAHRLCRQDEWMNEHQHRLSFSRAEIILLNSWTPVQQIVYHMLRVFSKIERLTAITNSTRTEVLSNYHIKTLMLWASELQPRRWWLDDTNVVRICVELLHKLAGRLADSRCVHYFISNCNLLDRGDNSDCPPTQQITARLLSFTESSFAYWFVDNYVRRCAEQCDENVSLLFEDLSTTLKIHNAVLGVLQWKLHKPAQDSLLYFSSFVYKITYRVHTTSLTLRSCLCWIRELSKLDQHLSVYFTAITFLHVARKTTKGSLNDELLDVLATTCLQQSDARRLINARHSSVLSLSQAAKLIKVVSNNSRSTVQLIEIELSKAYLFRALRCKDSDNDSIYCLANVYLAVLYYTTEQYQMAIDHCMLVTRSPTHSQCSSRVVQGRVLPKIDDDIDSVLGLAVFYEYLRTTALAGQQQAQVAVFSTQLFATYLHMKCLLVAECRQFTETLSYYDTVRYRRHLREGARMSTSEVLLCRLSGHMKYTLRGMRVVRQAACAGCHTLPVSCHLDASQLVELLQMCAVEHLTTFRQLEAQYFDSYSAVVITDFEALYAYKKCDYMRCSYLAVDNVETLCKREALSCTYMYPEFLLLMDDDIASLAGLTLLVCPVYRKSGFSWLVSISQLSLSLYLVIQCLLKLDLPGEHRQANDTQCPRLYKGRSSSSCTMSSVHV